MKLVISLILNVIFAIALIVSLFFLRESNLEIEEAIKYLTQSQASHGREINTSRKLRQENDELKAELEKNIAARSRLKEMLAEARKSSPEIITTPGTIQNAPKIPASLLSERTARPPTFADEKRDYENAFGKHATQQASKSNASQAQ